LGYSYERTDGLTERAGDRQVTSPTESNARETTRKTTIAEAIDCRWCARPIYLAICRDGRWRSFERDLMPPAPRNVWAWRKRHGMEETDRVHGYRLHFCAEYADAHDRLDLSGIVPPPSSDR
jgi:hypothetical protein